jgi:hypothetical protein
MTVAAGWIVKGIDVVGDLGHGQLTVPIDLLLNSFLLQAAEEGLRDGIDAPMFVKLLLGPTASRRPPTGAFVES